MKEITIEGKRVRVRTINTEPSRTQQQFKEQCDVNNIIARYKQTGELFHLNKKLGVYADVSEIRDYQESLQRVMDANAAFAALPSDLRLRFNNDPAALLQFLQNPNNYDEGVKIGLFEPKKQTDSPAATTNNDSNDKRKSKPAKEEQLDFTQTEKK